MAFPLVCQFFKWWNMTGLTNKPSSLEKSNQISSRAKTTNNTFSITILEILFFFQVATALVVAGHTLTLWYLGRLSLHPLACIQRPGGQDKITCTIILYDVMQSRSTAFLRGIALSMHPEEYPPRKDYERIAYKSSSFVRDHAALLRMSANADFSTPLKC